MVWVVLGSRSLLLLLVSRPGSGRSVLESYHLIDEDDGGKRIGMRLRQLLNKTASKARVTLGRGSLVIPRGIGMITTTWSVDEWLSAIFIAWKLSMT